jgi:enterochelin esterase-like enzyme
MKIIITALCFVLSAQQVFSQQKLVPNETAVRAIEPGKTDSFSVLLKDGDYVSASIAQHGKVNLMILKPDGSVMRREEGPAGDAKNSFTFAAEGGGLYLIKIANPGEQPVSYELLLEKIVSLDERLRPAPWEDPTPSPRIQALSRQIASGQKNTEAFWQEVTARGTPLVEPFGSDGNYQLVTFLWRSIYDTRNVLVIGSFWGVGAPAAYAMHRIGDSDVWYLSLKLPRGARFTYQLSPNDPMTSNGVRAEQRSVTRQSDPLNLNPLSKCTPDTSKFDCGSVAELPGAVAQTWFARKPGIPEGRLEKQTIKSNIQKIERPFTVYTPANYKANGPPNALLIMFDGEDLSDDTFRLTTLNNLIAASKIPPTVAVFVENVPRRRLVDLVANPEFADFLAAELVPWIRTRYNVSKGAAKVVVGGFSAGGLAATYIALRHAEIFGNVLSGSGAFWWSPNATAESAAPGVRIQAGAPAAVPATLRRKAISWLSNSSPAPNCRCASILRREHSKQTRTAGAAAFWKLRVICATCYWQRGMRFTINSSSAATTV